MTDHYEILGVEPDAPREEIREVYRTRIGDLDRTLANPKLRNRQSVREEKAAVNRAWTVLADPYQRERYDATLDGGADGVAGDEETKKSRPAASAATEPGTKLSFRERMRSSERVEREGGRSPGPDAAPVMKRLAAAMMDVVVMGAFVIALQGLAFATVDEVSEGLFLLMAVIVVVFVGLYNVVPVLRTGQTLGKRLAGLKLVRAEDGGPLDRRAVIRRYSVPVLLVALGAQVFLMVALLLGLSFLFSQTRISLLDRLARSRVVLATE